VAPDSGASALLRNTIVARNFNLSHRLDDDDDVAGALDPAGAFNLIGDATGMTGLADGVHGNQLGSQFAPIDPVLGPLQDNRGPTFTRALLPGSPALDRGGPDTALDALTPSDQRGTPRAVRQPFGIVPAGGDGRDIGAYELPAQTTPTVLTVNSLADDEAP